jgi:hypothetical protein
MKLHAKLTSVAERPSHRLRAMMKVDDDLVDAVTSKILGDVTNEWFS